MKGSLGMGRLLLALVVVGSAVLEARADAAWSAAASGDWRTAANWVDSVEPSSAGRTYITNASAAYTVTLGSGADVTTMGLTVSGKTSSSYQTKLNISGTKLISDGAKPSITYGAVTVGSGAELEFKNSAGAAIGAAGKIEIDGGAFVMTNGITAPLAVGSSTWVSGGYPAFSVKSGNAYFKRSDTLMSFLNYSLFQMTGGKVEMIDTSANHNATLFVVNGNSAAATFFSMSGDSELLFSQGGNFYLGWGTHEFKGNAKLTFRGGSARNLFYMSPYYSDNSKKVTVNISDNVKIAATSLASFEFGKADLRTGGTTGEFNISGGDIKLGYSAALGAGIGKYNVNMTGGRIDFPQYGVRIGSVPYNLTHPTDSNSKDLANTTTVTVAGGTFACTAADSHNNTPKKDMWGFIVGAGLVGRTYAHMMNGWVDGRINLQPGGTITNGCALKMFGVGRGIGTMTQTGGTYVDDSAARQWYDNGHGAGYHRETDSFVLGAFGGEGIYDMQGGTATIGSPLFVGGITLKMISRTDDDNKLPADTAGQAVGTLKVSGGTMTVQYQSYVGYDGKGTIDVSGNGSLTFHSNLILTNNAVNASTLKVTLADGAVPTFKVDGKLTVCDGAKLVVDAEGFTGGEKWTKIIDVGGGRTGSFDPANIEFSGKGRIVQSRAGDASGSIWLNHPDGCCLIIF